MTGSSTGGGETYAVKSGDTLTKIAKAHGMTVKTIEAANPKADLSTTKIKVGEKLKIPAKAEAAAPAAPAPGVRAPAPAVAPAARPRRLARRTDSSRQQNSGWHLRQ